MTRTTRIATATLAALLLAVPAMAQTAPAQAPADAPRAATERRSDRGDRAALSARVTAAEAIRAVEAAGYRGVTELEWERGAWEVKALTAEGARARLLVDGTTGAVTQKTRR
jgi:hypothetical protein